MFTGFYSSSAGMLAQMKNMNIIANNIANISTSGYKKDRGIFRSFYDSAINSSPSPLTSNGTILQNRDNNSLPVIERTVTDYENGVTKQTGNVLDVAIAGDGFFELMGANGETYFTRQGSFTLNENREMVTADGLKLMGELNTIKFPESLDGSEQASISIDENGHVAIGEESVGDINIVTFNDNNALKKIGKSLFVNENKANESDELFSGRIAQGHIEMSNVNPVEEMTQMITANRSFEAYQRSLRAIMEEATDKSINLIGRVR